MLSGKRFKLTAPILGITPTNGDVRNGPDRTVVHVPAGEVITILSGPREEDKRLMDIRWGDKQLIMFYEDVMKRGEQMKETPA